LNHGIQINDRFRTVRVKLGKFPARTGRAGNVKDE